MPTLFYKAAGSERSNRHLVSERNNSTKSSFGLRRVPRVSNVERTMVAINATHAFNSSEMIQLFAMPAGFIMATNADWLLDRRSAADDRRAILVSRLEVQWSAAITDDIRCRIRMI